MRIIIKKVNDWFWAVDKERNKILAIDKCEKKVKEKACKELDKDLIFEGYNLY